MRSYLRRSFPASALLSSFVSRTPARPGLSLFRMVSAAAATAPSRSLPRLPVFEAIARHDPESTVVVHSLSGRRFKYGELLGDVCKTRDRLHEAAGKEDIGGERIAFLVENSYDYVVTLLAILAARSIAVPLSPAFPPPELQYILDHSEASLLLSSAKFAAKAKEVVATELASKPTLVELTKFQGGSAFEDVELASADPGRAGMMLYTSGTTSRPKGVLLPERVMTAQAKSLLTAWEYAPSDHLLHVLPLHHIHGTINAVFTPLFSGSSVEFLFPFNADWVWRRLAAPFLAKTESEEENGEPKTNGETTNGEPIPNGGHSVNGEPSTNGGPVANGDHIANGEVTTNGTATANGGDGELITNAESTTNGEPVINGKPTTNGEPATNGTATTNGHHANNGEPKTNGVAKAKDENQKDIVTFFTVVPTVYSRLLTTHKGLTPELQRAAREAISPAHLRVNISGSAALPTPVKKAWQDLSHGNVLLERFGMTEVGMALSCGLDNADRVDGSVGWPLPGVEARLVDVDSGEVIAPGQERRGDGKERAGEIQLRGPTVFAEYWRNPAATAKEFVDGGDGGARWFRTGDVAVRRAVAGAGRSGRASQAAWARGGDLYFILGRKSADIIKSGGEKVSALEVERELLSLPQVAEAAVCAVPSGKWGHKVGAVVVVDAEHLPGGRWTPMDMRRALKRRLVNYKIPQVLRLVDHIPRNAMGKINKKLLVADVFRDDYSGDEAPPAPPVEREAKRRRIA